MHLVRIERLREAERVRLVLGTDSSRRLGTHAIECSARNFERARGQLTTTLLQLSKYRPPEVTQRRRPIAARSRDSAQETAKLRGFWEACQGVWLLLCDNDGDDLVATFRYLETLRRSGDACGVEVQCGAEDWFPLGILFLGEIRTEAPIEEIRHDLARTGAACTMWRPPGTDSGPDGQATEAPAPPLPWRMVHARGADSAFADEIAALLGHPWLFTPIEVDEVLPGEPLSRQLAEVVLEHDERPFHAIHIACKLKEGDTDELHDDALLLRDRANSASAANLATSIAAVHTAIAVQIAKGGRRWTGCRVAVANTCSVLGRTKAKTLFDLLTPNGVLVGPTDRIDSTVAREWSGHFYGALATGCSVAEGCELATRKLIEQEGSFAALLYSVVGKGETRLPVT